MSTSSGQRLAFLLFTTIVSTVNISTPNSPFKSLYSDSITTLWKSLGWLLSIHFFGVMSGIWKPIRPVKSDKKSQSSDQTDRLPVYVSTTLYALVASIVGTILIYSALVLFGAPVFDYVEKTWLAAAYISFLIVFPTACLIGNDGPRWIRLLSFQKAGLSELLFFPFICTVVGVWLGAFVIPLDWQRDWQKWPIPMVLGAAGGNVFGTLIGLGKSLVSKEEDARKED